MMFGLPFRAWAYIGCALAIIGAIVFFEQCAEHRGELRGESKVRSQWNKAIDEQLAATSRANLELSKSADVMQEMHNKKIVIVRKIVADFSQSAHDVSDENALYDRAIAAIRSVRVESGLGVADLDAATHSA